MKEYIEIMFVYKLIIYYTQFFLYYSNKKNQNLNYTFVKISGISLFERIKAVIVWIWWISSVKFGGNLTLKLLTIWASEARTIIFNKKLEKDIFMFNDLHLQISSRYNFSGHRQTAYKIDFFPNLDHQSTVEHQMFSHFRPSILHMCGVLALVFQRSCRFETIDLWKFCYKNNNDFDFYIKIESQNYHLYSYHERIFVNELELDYESWEFP